MSMMGDLNQVLRDSHPHSVMERGADHKLSLAGSVVVPCHVWWQAEVAAFDSLSKLVSTSQGVIAGCVFLRTHGCGSSSQELR